MPKRVTQHWLSRMAWGLTSGALALSVLTTGGSNAPLASLRTALAEDIDCYNDKDLYDLPECVERRKLDQQSGNQPLFAPNSGQPGAQQTGNQDPPPDNQGSNTGTQPPANTQSQQGSDDDEDKPQPHVAITDPKNGVLTVADAGKEATQYLSEEGTDKYGKWARTRFERDRSNGASALGPNVMYSKIWVATDLAAAKAVFAEQAAIKNFPERKEQVQGPVEKLKPTKFGEDFAFQSGYFQDDDNKIWQHYRYVMRQGTSVAVLYLYGREELFQDTKDRTWTGFVDWFPKTLTERM